MDAAFNDAPQRPRSRVIRAGAIIALGILVGGIVCAVMWLPPVIVGADLPHPTPKGSVPLSEAERLAAISSVRQHILWAAGGLIAIVTLVFTWRRDQITRFSATLDRDANFTSRYTEAISQLGSDNESIRLGGIYALERIASDSRRDHQTILDVLAAFVRATSPIPDVPVTPGPPLQNDIAACLEVIGRLSQLTRTIRPLNLAGCALNGANLAGARLENATLERADLRTADLRGANLKGADLRGAALMSAELTDADLTEARLERADLTEVRLFRAKLVQAHMPSVVMRTANLSYADLSYAMVHGAKMPDCNLIGAKLVHADLRNAELSRSALMQADLTDADLTGVDVESFDSSNVNLDVAIFSNGVD